MSSEGTVEATAFYMRLLLVFVFQVIGHTCLPMHKTIPKFIETHSVLIWLPQSAQLLLLESASRTNCNSFSGSSPKLLLFRLGFIGLAPTVVRLYTLLFEEFE